MVQLEISHLGAFQVSKEGKLVTRFETAPTKALLTEIDKILNPCQAIVLAVHIVQPGLQYLTFLRR